MKKGLLIAVFAAVAKVGKSAKHWHNEREEKLEAIYRDAIDYPAPPGVPLTEGEIVFIKSIFGKKIDEKVLRRQKKIFSPKARPDARAVTLWFGKGIKFYGPSLYEADYSQAKDPDNQDTFIHESTHVLQHQRKLQFPFRRVYGSYEGYDYKLSAQSRFKDFGLEQQAEIIKHYAGRFLYHHDRLVARFIVDGNMVENDLLLQKVVEDEFPEARKTRLGLELLNKEKTKILVQKLNFAHDKANDVVEILKSLHDKQGPEFRYDIITSVLDDKVFVETNIPVQLMGKQSALSIWIDAGINVNTIRIFGAGDAWTGSPVDPAIEAALPTLEEEINLILKTCKSNKENKISGTWTEIEKGFAAGKAEIEAILKRANKKSADPKRPTI